MRTHALITALVALTIGLSSASAQTVKWDFEGDATQWIPSETDPNTTGVGVADASGNRQGKALEIAGAVPESFGASYIPWRDWRPYGTLKLQVYLPKDAPADIDCYVYLKDKQYLWYQTAPFHVPAIANLGGDPGDDEKRVPVKMGAWNSITVDISPQSTSWEPGGHLKSWHRALYLPREFGVRFFSPTEWEGAVQIDDVQLIELRADQRRDKPFGANEPAIQLERNADSVPCYEKFELTFQTDKEPDNPFDPECIDVQGHFRAPSGKVTHVPGFYYQDYSRLLNDDGFEKLIPVGEP